MGDQVSRKKYGNHIFPHAGRRQKRCRSKNAFFSQKNSKKVIKKRRKIGREEEAEKGKIKIIRRKRKRRREEKEKGKDKEK